VRGKLGGGGGGKTMVVEGVGFGLYRNTKEVEGRLRETGEKGGGRGEWVWKGQKDEGWREGRQRKWWVKRWGGMKEDE